MLADWLARRSLGHDRGHDLTEPGMDASSELQTAGERQCLLQVEIAAIEKKLTDRKSPQDQRWHRLGSHEQRAAED